MDFTKDSVHIRKRKLADGRTSLYLDIYSNGIRKYEFLKLYLVPESGKKSKMQNRETMHIAENMMIQRLAEVSMNPLKDNRNSIGLCWFIRQCISKKKKGTGLVYRNMLKLAETFFGNGYVLNDITEEKIREFFGFIGNVPNKNKPGENLSKSTQRLYCAVFNTVMRHAADERIVPYDISKRIKLVSKDDKERQYLTIEEVQMLASTRLKKSYRRAFLFGCLTGLRASDIEKLCWGNVFDSENGTRIVFTQKKTSSTEYLDISQQARQMMGERKSLSEKVFPRFHCNSELNKTLRKWVKSVGIDKYISFHCSRHTFAVMMLTLDTDIYTTSKLLGHKKLETTQIYAKIVDKKKQEAVAKIPIVI